MTGDDSTLRQHEPLDLITIGRSSIDLYGEQSGGRLEDMASFAKYVGGSPTNTAIGASRLGLRAGLITRVGNDHMGRFIREQIVREGVDASCIVTDNDRLTALVILGIRDPDTFPLIFYRENCADMALCEDDIDAGFIQNAAAVLVNGTHLSKPEVFAASYKAASLAKAAGNKVVFDIDYRPVLWGLTDKDMGENRFVSDAATTMQLQKIVPLCDLIVGTEEEIHILGGTDNTVAALRAIRSQTGALLVCKRGDKGCVAFDDEIPDDMNDGILGRGFAIEVFNVLGAGDSFMAGFLRGWLRDLAIATCCEYGNACGAIVVSRHGCAPAMPSWEELQLFLSQTEWPKKLRDSGDLEHIHWATNRAQHFPTLNVLAMDHRSQFVDMIEELGLPDDSRVPAFKLLAQRAVEHLAQGNAGFGLLLDGTYGARALEAAANTPFWIGRPIEVPGSRPIRFEGAPDVAITLRDWPVGQVVKCLVFYHPDDSSELRVEQDAQIVRLFNACRETRHELLLEIIASKHGEIGVDTVSHIIDHVYDLDVYPDWWKLEPNTDPQVWDRIEAAIMSRDPYCRGVVLLGLSMTQEALLATFDAAARSPIVKGFAVGRTIFHEIAMRWLKSEIDDESAVDALAANFATLVDAWQRAKDGQTVAAVAA